MKVVKNLKTLLLPSNKKAVRWGGGHYQLIEKAGCRLLFYKEGEKALFIAQGTFIKVTQPAGPHRSQFKS